MLGLISDRAGWGAVSPDRRAGLPRSSGEVAKVLMFGVVEPVRQGG
jgi:hypothetical protein